MCAGYPETGLFRYLSVSRRRQKLWNYAGFGNEPIKWSTSLKIITNNIFSCFSRLSHAWSWLSFFLICWLCAAVWPTLYLPSFLPTIPHHHQGGSQVKSSQHTSTFPDTQYSLISPALLSPRTLPAHLNCKFTLRCGARIKTIQLLPSNQPNYLIF